MRYIILVVCVVICFGGCACISNNREPVFIDFQVEKKVNYLQDWLHVNPNDIEKRIELSRVFLSEGMFEEAIVELERVLDIDNSNVKARLLLSSALQSQSEPDLPRICALLEKTIQIAPGNAIAHLNLAQVYDKLKKESKAIGEFEQVLELSDDSATLLSAHLGLMAIYKRQQKEEKANREYEKARRIYPGIDEMIRQAEISRLSPSPAYQGTEKGDGIHPLPEERIRRLKKKFSGILEEHGQ